MRRTTIAIGLLFPTLLAGCFKLARETTVLRQYVLGSATEAATGPAGGLSIGLRRLDLAAYLDVPAVMVRRGTHALVVSDFHRWGEDPGSGINRAVAGYLASGAGIGSVEVAPWSMRTPHDFLVQLHVSRFEGVAPADTMAVAGEALLEATWEIIRPADGALIARGSTAYRAANWTVGDYEGLVTLLDRGLVQLAREVAECLSGGVTGRTCEAAAARTP